MRSRLLKLGYPVVKVIWMIWKPYFRTIRVVIRNEDDVLLVRHTYGTQAWGVPGGGLKRGEDPIAAAIRETREETGVELVNARLLPGNPFPMVPHGRGEFWVCVGEAASRDFVPDGVEVEEVRWFPLGAIPGEMLQQGQVALEEAGIITG